MEKRLIDANLLKGDFMFLRKMWSGTEVVEMIDNAPTVDAVEVVHGRWLKRNWSVTCSVCGSLSIAHDGKNYCPYCGAKMDS